jgi:azurin
MHLERKENRRIMSRTLRLFVPLLTMALAAGACGGSSEPASNAPAAGTSTSPAATPAPSAPASAPGAAAVHDGRKIEIGASDAMKFDVTEITAKPGERLSVTLVNKGTMPKFSMGHNFVLLTAAADPAAFVAVAAEAPTTDYVPASRKSEIIAATKLLGPNEQDTVTFAAPTTPGRYTFLCSFPGHFAVGMRGVLIVE